MGNKLGDNKLVVKFNSRDSSAFEEVYLALYDELHYYTAGLYRDTRVESCDIVHDVFIALWDNKSIKFDEILNIKAYLYVSIRNRFKSHLTHIKCVDKYNDYVRSDEKYFEVDIIESEVLAQMHNILNILPRDSAEILSMMLKGWSIEEIAESMGKTKRTIYNKKSEAISFLRRKISDDKIFLLIHFIGV